MRRCIQEDVEPAMFMLKKANVLRTIEATMENRLFIEATENTVSVGPNSSSDMIHESCCSACDHPMMTLPYPDRRPRGGNIIAYNFLFFSVMIFSPEQTSRVFPSCLNSKPDPLTDRCT